MNPKSKRFNWRVSEAVAAEMAQRMQAAGMKSWNEFFQAMMEQWDAATGSVPTLSTRTLEGVRLIIQEELNIHETISQRSLGELHEKFEVNEALNESLHASVDEFTRAVHGIHKLLAMALNVPEEKPEQSQEPSSKAEKTGGIPPHILERLRRRG